MALHWHVGKIENFEQLCWVPAEHDSGMPGGYRKGDLILNPVTDGLIHATNASTIAEPVFLRRMLRLAESGQGDGAVTNPAEWGVTTHAEWMRTLEQHQNGES